VRVFHCSGYCLTIDEPSVWMEVLNERNHSAGWAAECTLEQFIAGTFHDETRQYLGEKELAEALAVARELLAKKQAPK